MESIRARETQWYTEKKPAIQEFETAVSQTKSGKAVCSDGLSEEIYEYSGLAIRQNLSRVIETICDNEKIDVELKNADVVTVYKRGKGTKASVEIIVESQISIAGNF